MILTMTRAAGGLRKHCGYISEILYKKEVLNMQFELMASMMCANYVIVEHPNNNIIRDAA